MLTTGPPILHHLLIVRNWASGYADGETVQNVVAGKFKARVCYIQRVPGQSGLHSMHYHKMSVLKTKYMHATTLVE